MRCPSCGYVNENETLNCNLCGMLFRRVAKPSSSEEVDLTATDEIFAATEAPEGEAAPVPESESEAQADLPGWFLDMTNPQAPVKYALVCFPLSPVALDENRATVIGRAEGNDLVLPVGMVSRRHAQVFWNGEAFIVKDLGSSNGTIINGRKVGAATLKDGDVLTIGPYNIEFKSFRGSIDTLKETGGDVEVTQNLSTSDVMGASPTFSGKIGEMRMEEVFQLIEFNKKTGTLKVESGEKEGTFPFRNGQILDADFHHSSGETAVARLLRLTSGSFDFSSDDPQCEQTIFESTAKVLLNALRRLDEMGR